MKPNKLSACLVTLFFCGLPLCAAAADALRVWTDVQGRTIEARLLSMDSVKETVRIERADGSVFELPILRFSPADRAYARSWASTQAVYADGLRELTSENWEWLTTSGSLQAGRYVKVPVKEMTTILNNRLAKARLTSEKGSLSGLRFDENAGLEAISAEFDNTISLATFFREVAKANNLRLLVDGNGILVLRRSGQPPANKNEPAKIEFLGVSN